ncbi:ATP-binding protein [Bacillus nitratireducens]|uniref:ATP-binding protein n=1 Tax=Bacillus nitratireducens TaxID=2026193 RepID=UPI00089575AC|nr:ATP-binding protein [Bacillus nitratireducens]SEB14379.1 KAP family P-loop domain-containing protein [Bacillus nitratireducens]
MKVYIEHEKISDSPYESGNDNDIFVYKDFVFFKQLALEITQGTATSFLISGYRGVGKTSFINKIKEQAVKENDNMLFVSLNFGKYEEFSLILRKIIREVYLSIDKKDPFEGKSADNENGVKELIKKNNPNLLEELGLIYDRTFYQVSESKKYIDQTEKTLEQNLEYNIKKTIISICVLVTAGVESKLKFIERILGMSNTNIDTVMFILATLWAGFQSYKLSMKYSKKKTELNELNRSSLYDNEIAEFQLRKILNGLKELDIKVVFVIDELDKIDDDVKLHSLISELKPLMLSGLASFILISGQQLYYRYQASHTIDDAIISSIFSKSIHIPLLATKGFHELFKNFLKSQDDINSDSVQDYVNSKILQSNRLPRRFLNLIRQNIIWENKASYINIEEKLANAFKTDTHLLNIIKEIETQEINAARFDNGIKDFLITQLHIWVQKIKLYRYIPFTLNDIYNFDNYSKEVHSGWYLGMLNTLATKLLDTMVKNDLLKKESLHSDEEVKEIYKWRDEAEVIVEEADKPNDIKWNFMNEFARLEKLISDIWIKLCEELPFDESENQNNSILSIINNLYKLAIINQYTFGMINDLYPIRNSIVNGKDINDEQLKNIIESKRFFDDISPSILTEVSHYLIKQYLTKQGFYHVKDPSKNVLFHKFKSGKGDNKQCLCFEFQFLESNVYYYNDFNRILDNFIKYKAYNKESYLVVIMYYESDETIPDVHISDLYSKIEEDYAELRRYIFIYHYKGFSPKEIEADIQDIFEKRINVYQEYN